MFGEWNGSGEVKNRHKKTALANGFINSYKTGFECPSGQVSPVSETTRRLGPAFADV